MYFHFYFCIFLANSPELWLIIRDVFIGNIYHIFKVTSFLSLLALLQ